MSPLNAKKEKTMKIFLGSLSVPLERIGEEPSAEKLLETTNLYYLPSEEGEQLGCRCGIRAICYKR